MEVIASDVAAVDVSRACDGNIEVCAGDVVPLMSPEPATEILRLSVFSPFSVPRLPNLQRNAVQLFCGHTYFQFIIGYADILLEADVEGIVLDTDIQ